MAVTVTKNTSWSQRLGGSVKGLFFGLLIFILAFPLLIWNEGRAVKTYKTLNEGAGIVVEGSTDAVDGSLEGKLIHGVGDLAVGEEVYDDTFGVSGEYIALKRNVEMYQWVELSESTTKDKLGGGTETTTTYSYQKAWQSTLNESGSFAESEGHENPSEFRYEATTVRNPNVTLGAFLLDEQLTNQVKNFQTLVLEEEMTTSLQLPTGSIIDNGKIYVGEDPSQPEVGDIRISFEFIEPHTVSVIAKQAGDKLVPYLAETGSTIAMLTAGDVSAEQMFAQAHASNKVMTWVLRALGVFMLYLGLYMMVGLLEVIADVVPFVGALVGVGLKLISFLVALLLGAVVIALSWLAFRPLLAIILLVVAAGILVGIFYIAKKHKK